MSANAPPPPSVDSWKASYLRVLVFTKSTAYGSDQQWWQWVTGNPPSDVSDRPTKKERTEVGTLDGVKFELDIDLIKVRWTAEVEYTSDDELAEIPTLGPFVHWRDRMVGLMEKWLAVAPPVTRLTLAGRLEQPVPDHTAGYELMNRYLRCVDLDPKSSDLLYRINRRIDSKSGVPNLVFNRLTTWLVRKMVRAAVPSNPTTSAGERVVMPVHEALSCAVEFDFNTTLDFSGELPHDRLPAILNELAGLVTILAERGDERP